MRVIDRGDVVERSRGLSRSAFTLVELLVVIAIIGMLVALLLPAVQSARLAAQKIDAANRLRQIGLGIANHASSQRYFPSGYESDSASPQRDPETWDGPTGWAWGAQLLPFIEEQPLYDQLQWSLPCWHAANAAAVTTQVAVFINPAAPNRHGAMQVLDRNGQLMTEFGRSHFVANVGHDEPWEYTVADHSKIANGAFFRNSRLSEKDITDGMSKTVFIGEHSVISDKTWVGVVPGAEVCPIDPQRFPFTECDEAATLVLAHSGPSADEGDVIHPPNFPTCHVCQMYAPYSQGAYVLLGDGSVHFVSSMINVDVWAALCSRNGGEVFDHVW